GLVLVAAGKHRENSDSHDVSGPFIGGLAADRDGFEPGSSFVGRLRMQMPVVTGRANLWAARLPGRCRAALSAALVAACVVGGWAGPSVSAAADDGIDHFEKKIRPVLVQHCYECHSAAAAKA